MYLLQFKYDIDDIILEAHLSYFVSGLVTSAGGTGNKGLYVLVLSISIAWKILKFQHKTTSLLRILKYIWDRNYDSSGHKEVFEIICRIRWGRFRYAGSSSLNFLMFRKFCSTFYT